MTRPLPGPSPYATQNRQHAAPPAPPRCRNLETSGGKPFPGRPLAPLTHPEAPEGGRLMVIRVRPERPVLGRASVLSRSVYFDCTLGRPGCTTTETGEGEGHIR